MSGGSSSSIGSWAISRSSSDVSEPLDSSDWSTRCRMWSMCLRNTQPFSSSTKYVLGPRCSFTTPGVHEEPLGRSCTKTVSPTVTTLLLVPLFRSVT